MRDFTDPNRQRNPYAPTSAENPPEVPAGQRGPGYIAWLIVRGLTVTFAVALVLFGIVLISLELDKLTSQGPYDKMGFGITFAFGTPLFGAALFWISLKRYVALLRVNLGGAVAFFAGIMLAQGFDKWRTTSNLDVPFFFGLSMFVIGVGIVWWGLRAGKMAA